MKKQLLLATLLTTSLSAVDIKMNYCDINRNDAASDTVVFGKADEVVKSKLNLTKNEVFFNEAIKKLSKNPFEQDYIEAAITILLSDISANNSSNSLSANSKYVMILFDSFMWIESDELKLKAIQLMSSKEAQEIINRNGYLNKSYKNLLIYENLGKKVKEVKPMNPKVNKDDIPYQLFYSITHDIDVPELSESEMKLLLNTCFDIREIEKKSSSMNSKETMYLFALSKINKKHENEIIDIYNITANGSEYWSYLTMVYNTKNRYYSDAALNMEYLYGVFQKSYFDRPASKAYYLASLSFYENGDLFSAWSYSYKALNLVASIKDKNSSDSVMYKQMKNTFERESVELIEYYKEKKDIVSANDIRSKTNDTMRLKIVNHSDVEILE
jgi:hypothetical protein